MKGSTRKRGKTWSYIIDIGKIDGVRKQKEKGGFLTQKEAQMALISALNEMNTTGNHKEDTKITFQELFKEFIEIEAPMTRSHSTIVRYKSIYQNHLFDNFASQYIFNISHQQIQAFLIEKNKSYSEEYTRSIFNLLLVIFKYAIKMDYLAKSPFIKVIVPKNPRIADEVEIYTKTDLIKKKQNEARVFLGEMYKDNMVADARIKDEQIVVVDNFVNIKPDGCMLTKNNHKIVSRIVKNENLIVTDFKYHNLRHTHATILLESGINPKYIQERLGQSKLEFTLRLYTHVTRKMEQEASALLDKFFS